MKQTAKIIGFVLYFLILFGVTGKLFFEDSFNRFISLFKFRGVKIHTITIGYTEPFLSLHPLANDTGSRSRLLHIFEALVRVTPDLQIESGLAISYGSLDDLTWEFKLRPEVQFHDGAPLTVDDVIWSLTEAKNNKNSGVKDLASSMREIRKIDSQIFQIVTETPDPLLLQKLASFLIFPKRAGQLPIPPGTGPYRIEEVTKDAVTLKRFEEYWGTLPASQTVVLKSFTSKEEKSTALKNRDIDILANLPADLANQFSYPKYQLASLPSLEVNFLMFHFDRTFRSRMLREAVALALKPDQLARLAQGFAVPTEQFVGDGIFGYDPEIPFRIPDPSKAASLVRDVVGSGRVAVSLDLPKGLEVFGENVKKQLEKVGIDVYLSLLTPEQLGSKILQRQSEFFFFGWRSELGDASDFLTAVVHSPAGSYGQFNGGNYRNSEVDRLIELSQETLKPAKRLEKLRAVMRKITIDDIIGVPLFSPEVIYAVSDDVTWKPRVDGYVLAQDVRL